MQWPRRWTLAKMWPCRVNPQYHSKIPGRLPRQVSGVRYPVGHQPPQQPLAQPLKPYMLHSLRYLPQPRPQTVPDRRPLPLNQ
jgi:hypothetical protein